VRADAARSREMPREFRVPVARSRVGALVTAASANLIGAPYTCVADGRALVLRSGARVRAHFAHKANESCGGAKSNTTGREMIEHATAKAAIAEHLHSLRLEPRCVRGHIVGGAQVTFARSVDHAVVELATPDGKYRIDTAVVDNTRRMTHAIEIRNTHAVDREKWISLDTLLDKRVYEVSAGLFCASFAAWTPGEPLIVGYWRPDHADCPACAGEAKAGSTETSLAPTPRRPCCVCGEWRNLDGPLLRRLQAKASPCRYTYQYVCESCVVDCPSCAGAMTHEQRRRFTRCRPCATKATEWEMRAASLTRDLRVRAHRIALGYVDSTLDSVPAWLASSPLVVRLRAAAKRESAYAGIVRRCVTRWRWRHRFTRAKAIANGERRKRTNALLLRTIRRRRLARLSRTVARPASPSELEAELRVSNRMRLHALLGRPKRSRHIHLASLAVRAEPGTAIRRAEPAAFFASFRFRPPHK
jgi:hypothetical protein